MKFPLPRKRSPCPRQTPECVFKVHSCSPLPECHSFHGLRFRVSRLDGLDLFLYLFAEVFGFEDFGVSAERERPCDNFESACGGEGEDKSAVFASGEFLVGAPGAFRDVGGRAAPEGYADADRVVKGEPETGIVIVFRFVGKVGGVDLKAFNSVKRERAERVGGVSRRVVEPTSEVEGFTVSDDMERRDEVCVAPAAGARLVGHAAKPAFVHGGLRIFKNSLKGRIVDLAFYPGLGEGWGGGGLIKVIARHSAERLAQFLLKRFGE